MIKLNTPIEIRARKDFDLEDLVFIHLSSDYYSNLRPVTYNEVAKNRSADYMKDRKSHEKKHYHSKLKDHDKNKSFLYASLASRSKLHDLNSLLEYPGYIYYFKLTPAIIKDCIFEVCGGKEYKQKESKKGLAGLKSSINEWDKNSKSFKSYYDEVVEGYIDPRIEVVIPHQVKPFAYIPQIEDRVFYHGSRKNLKELKKGSYITTYRNDAAIFAIPWSTDDLVINYSLSPIKGRPPEMIFLDEDDDIEDIPLYIYEIKNTESERAKTNTGFDYSWNRVTLEEASTKNGKLKLIEKIPSWKERFLI
tara:strand:- start:1822 stop:2739 length:918 start_codon:yes stop_codon:yes gene_type:complete